MRGMYSAILGLALGLTGAAWGHLDTAGTGANGAPTSFSMSPVGPYSFGDSVIVTFTVTTSHNGPTGAVSFSQNNGSTWASAGTFPVTSTGVKTFKWAVPTNSATGQGKIRVTYPGTMPGTSNDDYNIISKSFVVQGGSPILSYGLGQRAFSVRQSAGILFLRGPGLTETSRVEILAVDGQILLTRVFSQTGSGEISLPTARLAKGEAFLRVTEPGRLAHVQKVFITR